MFLTQPISLRNKILIFLAIIVVLVFVLHAMGRLPICACGYVKLWQNEVMSAENSQHIADWYSFTHIMHGFGFFLLMWLVSKYVFKKYGGLPMGTRLLIAVFLEATWEVIENTSWIINYYRANTVSLGYVGDSIINSVGDVLVMSLGFYIAKKLPVWATILLFVVLEIILTLVIRDNLTLNILMFVYPFQAIKAWQTGI